jgi:3-hydroxymyristoyl/3-hydroxydecanoyl-(acyl carrier protein) dehydratase
MKQNKQTKLFEFFLMKKFTQNSIIGYVLLSNIYWQHASLWECWTLEKKKKGVKKQLGIWIEMNSEVHTFVIDDKSTFESLKSM